ncbi:hypothetical protein JL721_10969 [Aureococcus anophagefferens]|nr:hypothetical protein JL721_10969 [Aureococcus anophagefferens]KAH8061833.1 hypothetical protein JL722_3788 [Aureococcus anophagefferens]
MVYLGNLYVTGSGLKLDKKKAERLFRMAADRGDAFGQNKHNNLYAASSPEPGMLRLRTGESRLALASSSAAAFLSAPTFAVWCLAFLNAKPARRKDAAAEGGMEIDMSAML